MKADLDLTLPSRPCVSVRVEITDRGQRPGQASSDMQQKHHHHEVSAIWPGHQMIPFQGLMASSGHS